MSHKADIGFLGGGQLGRMSIQAAQRMGLRCLSLDAGEDTPAAQVAPAIQGALSDPEAIAALLSGCDWATLENEFIPAEALRGGMAIAGFDPDRLTPRVETLAIVQDKFAQRQAYAKAGVPSPRAVVVADNVDLPFPFVLKARFGGYDGKGTKYAHNLEEFEALRSVWSQPHALQPDEAWFYAVHSGSELDLLIRKDGRTIGIECKRQDAPRLTRSMSVAMADLNLDELWVVYPGEREYALGERIRVRPLLGVAGAQTVQ